MTVGVLCGQIMTVGIYSLGGSWQSVCTPWLVCIRLADHDSWCVLDERSCRLVCTRHRIMTVGVYMVGGC